MSSRLRSFAIFFVLALTAEAHSQTKIFVGIPARTVGFLPLFIAEEKGFFKAEGLDVLNVVMRPESSIASLPSGEVQFGHGQSAVRAAMKGAPVKAVIFLYDRPTMVLMARPEIQSFENLRGKKVATSSVGGDTYLQTVKLLKARGLVKDKDYGTVLMGPDPQRLQAMMQGLVHATMLNVDHAAIAESRFPGVRRLSTIEDLGKALFSGLGTSDKFLTERPDTVKRFHRATLKGILLMRDQPEEAARIAQKMIKLDPTIGASAVRSMREAIPAADPGGAPEAVIQEYLLDNAELTGMTVEEAKRVKISDVISMKLLREAQEDLGIFCKGGYGCKK
jgi:NitT/TauT family transport system substrate-binding protein